MSDIGKIERETQNRVIKLFQDELAYSYLGNWEKREGNSNVETDILKDWLLNKRNLPANLVDKTLFEVENCQRPKQIAL